jgi:hypothetical protein
MIMKAAVPGARHGAIGRGDRRCLVAAARSRRGSACLSG